MPDGLAVPLFYLIAIAIWAFIRLTKPRQRQSMLEWCLITVFCFGGAGWLVSALR